MDLVRIRSVFVTGVHSAISWRYPDGMDNGHANPTLADPRRFSIWLALRLWLALAVVAAQCPAAAGDDPSASAARKKALLPVQIFKPATTLNRARFQYASAMKMLDAGKMREYFDTRMQEKIVLVDQICGLTDSQKQKLQLAGRGDILRGLDRAEKIERQFQIVRDNMAKINELCQEALHIRVSLIVLTDDDTLFVKTLEKSLTPEQSARYEPLRALYRLGGRAVMNSRGSREGLAIILLGTEFADDDMVLLGDVPNVHSVNLSGTRVTDAGMTHLPRLTSLERLDLSETKVTDMGLAELKGMTGLEAIDLRGTSVTDAGMVHVSGLIRLQRLDLHHMQVTDAGLRHLKGLPGLLTLGLAGTRATDAGVAELREVLPELGVEK
jgi:hypothetical protein